MLRKFQVEEIWQLQMQLEHFALEDMSQWTQFSFLYEYVCVCLWEGFQVSHKIGWFPDL